MSLYKDLLLRLVRFSFWSVQNRGTEIPGCTRLLVCLHQIWNILPGPSFSICVSILFLFLFLFFFFFLIPSRPERLPRPSWAINHPGNQDYRRLTKPRRVWHLHYRKWDLLGSPCEYTSSCGTLCLNGLCESRVPSLDLARVSCLSAWQATAASFLPATTARLSDFSASRTMSQIIFYL